MARSQSKSAFPSQEHNHSACIDDAIVTAEQRCRDLGLRFTPLRQRVLEIIWSRHEPVGAYEIMEELRDGTRIAAPPTVYRTLDFLVKNGFVHKIQSLNAFVGCGHVGQSHAGQFLICVSCNQVGELDDQEIAALIEKKAASHGFSVGHPTIEIKGTCQYCDTTLTA